MEKRHGAGARSGAPRALQRLVAATALALASVATATLPEPAAAAADDARAPAVVLYDGLGTREGALLSGRVIRNTAGLIEGSPEESRAQKIGRSLALLRLKPVAGMAVEVRLAGRTFRANTDAAGYFELPLNSRQLRGLGERRHRVVARPAAASDQSQWSEGSLFLWPKRGVTLISDLDDTAIESDVHRKMRLAWRTLSSNEHDLKPVEGLPELFQRLRAKGIPTVVLTSSPIQLYTRIRRGLELAGFPPAPLLMKRVSLRADGIRPHVAYKLERLDAIARLLPHHQFVLLGDTNNDDQEIFHRWARRTGRVKFIGIRDVDDHAPVDWRYEGQQAFRSARHLAIRLRAAGILSDGHAQSDNATRGLRGLPATTVRPARRQRIERRPPSTPARRPARTRPRR